MQKVAGVFFVVCMVVAVVSAVYFGAETVYCCSMFAAIFGTPIIASIGMK